MSQYYNENSFELTDPWKAFGDPQRSLDSTLETIDIDELIF